jgi:hypothetical protein
MTSFTSIPNVRRRRGSDMHVSSVSRFPLRVQCYHRERVNVGLAVAGAPRMAHETGMTRATPENGHWGGGEINWPAVRRPASRSGFRRAG